jgi:hypothetical protein
MYNKCHWVSPYFSGIWALLQDVLRAADTPLLEAKNQGRSKVGVTNMDTLNSPEGDIYASP